MANNRTVGDHKKEMINSSHILIEGLLTKGNKIEVILKKNPRELAEWVVYELGEANDTDRFAKVLSDIEVVLNKIKDSSSSSAKLAMDLYHSVLENCIHRLNQTSQDDALIKQVRSKNQIGIDILLKHGHISSDTLIKAIVITKNYSLIDKFLVQEKTPGKIAELITQFLSSSSKKVSVEFMNYISQTRLNIDKQACMAEVQIQFSQDKINQILLGNIKEFTRGALQMFVETQLPVAILSKAIVGCGFLEEDIFLNKFFNAAEFKSTDAANVIVDLFKKQLTTNQIDGQYKIDHVIGKINPESINDVLEDVKKCFTKEELDKLFVINVGEYGKTSIRNFLVNCGVSSTGLMYGLRKSSYNEEFIFYLNHCLLQKDVDYKVVIEICLLKANYVFNDMIIFEPFIQNREFNLDSFREFVLHAIESKDRFKNDEYIIAKMLERDPTLWMSWKSDTGRFTTQSALHLAIEHSNTKIFDLILNTLKKETSLEYLETVFKKFIIPITQKIEYEDKAYYYNNLINLITLELKAHSELIPLIPSDILKKCCSKDPQLVGLIVSYFKEAKPESRTPDQQHFLSHLFKNALSEEKEQVELVNDLLSAKAAIPYDALQLAIQKNHNNLFHLLLDAGADLEGKSFKYTPLYTAIEKGNADIVRLLLEKGVIPKERDFLIAQTNENILKLLEDKNLLSQEQLDSLGAAFKNTPLSVGHFLNTYGQDKIQAVNSVLVYASQTNNENILRLLCIRNVLKLSSDELKEVLNIRMQNGDTILHSFFSKENITFANSRADSRLKIIKELIKNGANPDLKNNSGLSLAFMAKVKGDLLLAEYLSNPMSEKFQTYSNSKLETSLQNDKKAIISSTTARVLIGDPSAIQEMAGYFKSSGRALLMNACAYITTPGANKDGFLKYIKDRKFTTKFPAEQIKLLELTRYLTVNLDSINLLKNTHPDIDPITLILLHMECAVHMSGSPRDKIAQEKLQSSLVSLLRDELGANDQQIREEMDRRQAIVSGIRQLFKQDMESLKAPSAPPLYEELPPPPYEDPFTVDKTDYDEVKKEVSFNDMPLPSAPPLPKPDYSQIAIPVAFPAASLVIVEGEVQPVVLHTPLVPEEKTLAIVSNNPSALFTKPSEKFSFADFGEALDQVYDELEKQRLELEKKNEQIDAGMSTPISESEDGEEKPTAKRKPLLG